MAIRVATFFKPGSEASFVSTGHLHHRLLPDNLALPQALSRHTFREKDLDVKRRSTCGASSALTNETIHGLSGFVP